jgi:transcriptional regulator with PAS, ATPase and Fis domain
VLNQIHTQLYTDAATGHLIERSFRLLVVAGPDQGKVFGLDAGTTLVGTHADNNLVLTDVTVSRYHLEIRVKREGIEVRDLDTTNGTKHGGVKVGQILITGATRIRVGKHTEIDIEPQDDKIALSEWPSDRFGNVLGKTEAMTRLFAMLTKVARTDVTIMLQGETGTGKEAFADAIHKASPRMGAPFVVVDCGSIPHELIASELFGHVKGSFTGASGDKQGLIAAANGGTLFLDEIGELALDLQPQLLRVLDRRQVRRVGATDAIDVDIRVIAATHRDLRQMVKDGTFREDLFYRLAVVQAMIPPLRERVADVPALAAYFAMQMGRGEFIPSPRLLDVLANHHWPGNVRELRNVVERALSLGEAGLTELADAHVPTMESPAAATPQLSSTSAAILEMPFKEAKAALVEDFERDYLVALLARHRGNISRAAAEAGIDRNYIHRLVKKYNLDVDRS